MLRCSTLMILAAASLTLCGCPLLEKSTDNNSDRNPGTTNPAATALLHQALASRPALSSFYASALMKIVDKPAKFGLTVSADILCARPGQLRIQATKAGVDAFDLGVSKRKVFFYVPRKHTLYKGDIKDLDKVASGFQPTEIMAQLLNPNLGLGQKQWLSQQQKSTFAHRLIMTEVHHPGQEWQRVTLSIRLDGTPELQRVEELNAKNEVILLKEYDRYHPVAKVFVAKNNPSRKKAAPPLILPHWLQITWPKKQVSLRLSFDEVQVNYPVDPDNFMPDVPERVKVKPIREAKMESDSPAGKTPRQRKDAP